MIQRGRGRVPPVPAPIAPGPAAAVKVCLPSCSPASRVAAVLPAWARPLWLRPPTPGSPHHPMLRRPLGDAAALENRGYPGDVATRVPAGLGNGVPAPRRAAPSPGDRWAGRVQGPRSASLPHLPPGTQRVLVGRAGGAAHPAPVPRTCPQNRFLGSGRAERGCSRCSLPSPSPRASARRQLS